MLRTKDLAGRPVDTAVTYPGGVKGVGFEGLRDFIRDHRQDQFVNNLCRKLLSYSLDRSLQLSDEALIDSMQTNLASARLRFRFDGGNHCHEPAVPKQANPRRPRLQCR